MLNHVAAESDRAWLAGLTSLAIAPRGVSGLRLSRRECPLAFGQNFLDVSAKADSPLNGDTI